MIRERLCFLLTIIFSIDSSGTNRRMLEEDRIDDNPLECIIGVGIRRGVNHSNSRSSMLFSSSGNPFTLLVGSCSSPFPSSI